MAKEIKFSGPKASVLLAAPVTVNCQMHGSNSSEAFEML